MRGQFTAKVILEFAGHPDYCPAHGEAEHASGQCQSNHKQNVEGQLARRTLILKHVKDKLQDIRIDEQQAVGQYGGNGAEKQVASVLAEIWEDYAKAAPGR